MRNLAGDKECDREIRRELERARIPAVIDEEINHPEVKARFRGRLGEFVFTRHWTYWGAYGPVPLEVARELYADPVGATDIRVAGHCGRPPPEPPWLHRWRDGRRVTGDARGGVLCVDRYHIDTEVGLRLFVDTLRKHRLTPPHARGEPWE